MKTFVFLGLILVTSFFVAVFIGEQVFVRGTFVIRPDFQEHLASLLSRQPNPSPIQLPSPVLSDSPQPTLLPTEGQSSIAVLAQCLSSKQFTMYGTAECPSCKLQKSYFGDSFSRIPYVDCDKNQLRCQTKNIHSYPTWEDQNGVQYKGAIPLEKLAELSGCPTLK